MFTKQPDPNTGFYATGVTVKHNIILYKYRVIRKLIVYKCYV